MRELFEAVFLPIPCPRCGYEIDVQIIDILLEARVFCSNCKSEVQLIDADTSMHAALWGAEGTMKDLQQRLRKSGS